MSAFCDILLAFSIEVATCAPEAPLELPAGDVIVWEYEVPEEEPVPEPPQTVEKIIVREVVKEVLVPTEPPKPEEKTEQQAPAEPETGFDVAAVGRVYRLRRAGDIGSVLPASPVPHEPDGETVDGTGGVGATAAALIPPPARYNHPALAGGDPVDNSRILAEDRYVTGILETSINTQLDGSVIIQTSRDVFGYHGRRILLPKGSRMVCDYESPKKIGEHRISLTCDRVLTAEHRAEIFQVSAPVGDAQGRAGVTGDVDNRFLESYGSAFVLTFISASVRAAVASARDSGSNDTDDQIISEAGEETSTRFGEITASVLQRTLNLKPIITVPQGTRVQIRPASDWYIKPAKGN